MHQKNKYTKITNIQEFNKFRNTKQNTNTIQQNTTYTTNTKI